MNYEKILDKNNLKVKHLIGEYPQLISYPEPDDVVFYFIFKNKKKYLKEDLKNQIHTLQSISSIEEFEEKFYSTIDFLIKNEYLAEIEEGYLTLC